MLGIRAASYSSLSSEASTGGDPGARRSQANLQVDPTPHMTDQQND